jgi:hypothetical protein
MRDRWIEGLRRERTGHNREESVTVSECRQRLGTEPGDTQLGDLPLRATPHQ